MSVDVVEQIEKFRDFLDENYRQNINEIILTGKKFLLIDFSDLLKYDSELADQLLDEPEETIKAFELSLENFEITNPIRVRFFNLPINQKIKIKDVRSEHLGQFLIIEGIVRQASDVRPQVTSAKFECPSCGNSISILQLDAKFKEPYRCTCGKKGRFRLLSKELVDAQRLVLEESPDSLQGGEQPKRLSIFLKEDLVEPIMERKTTPGSKVRVNGLVKEVPILLKSGAASTKYDLMMDSNFIEPLEETFEELIIDEKEEKEILELAKNPKIYEKFIGSIAPSIYGHSDIKEALTLQLMGGVRKERKDGTWNRGDIHILLVGDPGASKSSLLMYMSKVAPKARYVSGKSASAAGLCVAPDSLVMKNPGSIVKIKDEVENNLKNGSSVYSDGILIAKNKTSQKVYTLNDNLKIKGQYIDSFWKIKAPKKMVSIKLKSGKEISITKNTKLLTMCNNGLIWNKSINFKKGDFLATARQISTTIDNEIPTISLISRNPTVYGVKNFLKNLLKDVNKKKLAKELNINENNLYHNWIKEGARGDISLNDFRKILTKFNISENQIVSYINSLALYKGKTIKIPKYLNEDLLYFAGLIAGDGNLSEEKYSVKVRFVNNNKVLMNRFKKLSKKLFGINCYLSSERSESYGFCSLIVSEILNKLGTPISPKSHKIDMSNLLLNLSNNLVASFIAGYFDCDGDAVERKKNEGSCIIEISSSSKIILKKINLVLLRWGILSRVRKKTKDKNPSVKSTGKIIKAKHSKYILTIFGKENFVKFKENIKIRHPSKIRKLNKIINKINKYSTNVDVIPNSTNFIKHLKKTHGFSYTELGFRLNKKTNISRNKFRKTIPHIMTLVGNSDELTFLEKVSNSDIFWDQIKEVKEIKPKYDYVYDLTVDHSHNFLVNGVVVHNTGAVVKDEFLKGWALEGGAMALANGGFIMLDELDKMDEDDTSALHEGLEQQQISFSKANIQATLLTRVSALAAANPKLGRFDPYQPIAAQINLPPALINRFDLIFPMRDIPDEKLDTKIATHILDVHGNTGNMEPDIEPNLLRKYVSYAKNKVFPKLSDTAKDEIRNFYVSIRNSGGSKDDIKPIPISARQLEALIRLSEASAKIRLSNKITKDDAKRAIRILKKCLYQVGIDPQTGKLDVDVLVTGITTSQRNKIITVREVIIEFDKNGIKTIPVNDIISACKDKGLEDNAIEEVLEKMKREGEIFQPKVGFISKI